MFTTIRQEFAECPLSKTKQLLAESRKTLEEVILEELIQVIMVAELNIFMPKVLQP